MQKISAHPFTRQSLAKKPTRHIDMGISGELAAQTIYDATVPIGEFVTRCIAENEMTVGALEIEYYERFWLVSAAAVSPCFPDRYFVVVERDGEYQTSCGNDKTVGCILRQNGKYVPSTKIIPNRTAAIIIDLVKQHREARRQTSRVEEAIAC